MCIRDRFNYSVTHYFLPLIEHDSFLAMDNASIHNERELRIILAAKNITLVKLPPSSYDLNPIELVFGFTKGYERRWPELLNKIQCAFRHTKCFFSSVRKQCKKLLSKMLASFNLIE